MSPNSSMRALQCIKTAGELGGFKENSTGISHPLTREGHGRFGREGIRWGPERTITGLGDEGWWVPCTSAGASF
jgi:hypothetical protein